jgi:competence protein ComEC
MRRLSLLILAGASAVFLAAAGPRTAAGAKRDRPLDIYFIDVEGGAATLTVTPAGESILVDSGWPGLEDRDPKRMAHVAKDVAGLKQIDHYITTHWHTDHYGGIEGLTKLIPVRNFYDRGMPEEPYADDPKGYPALMAAYRRASKGRSTVLSAGDTVRLRAAGTPIELKILAAREKVVGEGEAELPISCAKHPAMPKDPSDNAKSLAMVLRYGNFDFLNCGDLTWNIEHKLACPVNRVGQIDLWQVTHHGWKESGNPALYEAIQPRSAVVVCGPHKGGSPEVIRRLKATPSLEAFFQLHRALDSSAEDNAPPERIMNMDEKCDAQFIRASVSPAGDRYTLYRGARKPLQTFAVQ